MMRIRGYDFVDEISRNHYQQLSNPDCDPATFFAAYSNSQYAFSAPHYERLAILEIVSRTSIDPKSIILLSDVFVKTNTTTGQSEFSLIYFAESQKSSCSGDDIAKFLEVLQKYQDYVPGQPHIGSGVLLTPGPLTSQASRDLSLINLKHTHFIYPEVIFNPTEHIYSSDMRVLSPEEGRRFLETNRIKPSLLPRVYSNEPTIKYLGASPGDIVEYQVESFIPDTLLSVETFHRLVVKHTAEKKKKR